MSRRQENLLINKVRENNAMLESLDSHKKHSLSDAIFCCANNTTANLATVICESDTQNKSEHSESYHLRFLLEGLPETTNKDRANTHWGSRISKNAQWKKLIRMKCEQHGKPPSPLKNARLTLIRHSSSAPDSDGLVSSFKPIIDALVYAGILIDDSYKIIGMPDYQWKKERPKRGKIEIIVSEVHVESSL